MRGTFLNTEGKKLTRRALGLKYNEWVPSKSPFLDTRHVQKNWHELFASFRICGLHGKIQNRSLEILSGQRKEAMPSFMSYFIGFAAVSLLRRIRGRKLGRWLMINA